MPHPVFKEDEQNNGHSGYHADEYDGVEKRSSKFLGRSRIRLWGGVGWSGGGESSPAWEVEWLMGR